VGSVRACRHRTTTGSCVLLVLALCALAASLPAQETTWSPPLPDAEEHEWIKLTSGEWLRGEIKSMRDEALEFDSEELDLLKLDWDDIAEIRSPRSLQYVFEDRRTATGPATMRDGIVKVRVGGEVLEFQAAQAVSIVEGASKEWDHWSLKASVGVVSRSGNTNQLDYNALVLLRREGGTTRFDTNYAGNLGTVQDEESVNNHVVNLRLDAFVTRRLFVTPAWIELYTDKFKNVDLRTTLAAGVGYDVVRGKKLDWYLQLSAGYQQTQYVSVEEGEAGDEQTWVVIPNTLLEWDPNDDIETSLKYNATIGIPDVKNTVHRLVALLEVELTGALDLTFSATWDRNENPKARADGSVPERDDLQLSFGLGVDL